MYFSTYLFHSRTQHKTLGTNNNTAVLLLLLMYHLIVVLFSFNLHKTFMMLAYYLHFSDKVGQDGMVWFAVGGIEPRAFGLSYISRPFLHF